MVKHSLILVISVKILTVCAVPIEMQTQWQSQIYLQSDQDEMLQQQLNIPQLQLLNEWTNNIYPPVIRGNNHPPFIIVIPDQVSQLYPWLSPNEPNVKKIGKNNPTEESTDSVIDDVESESVIIEANQQQEPEPTPEIEPTKPIFLIPNRRQIIGGIISAIPFLPIEINVPDTISWIYNGIAGIISGIGQRWPFNRPPQTGMTPENVKSLLTRLKTVNNNYPPILVLPDIAQVYPMNFQ